MTVVRVGRGREVAEVIAVQNVLESDALAGRVGGQAREGRVEPRASAAAAAAVTVENTAELVRVFEVAAAAAAATEGVVGGGRGGAAVRVAAHVAVEARADAPRRVVAEAARAAP